MNKAKLKTYAPAARREFIQAVTHRAHLLGLTESGIAPAEVAGDTVLIAGKAWPKKMAAPRDKLVARIRRDGFGETMEAAAYTWFNRFAALRYMELHGFLNHGYRVLSSRAGGLPEILDHAAELDLPGLPRQQVVDLKLAGDQDNALYRLLLIAQCNALAKAMPFLFERIDDETELLLPDNLLHTDSVVAKLVVEIPEEDWQQVEIIGWLYQFYISEKKDQVIGKVVRSEDIPAATQLFTPNWIVQYLVQNSVGRLWLMANPGSPLASQWPYYIQPAEQTPEVNAQLDALIQARMDEDGGSLNPETITVLDPACGSGHILVVAYDLLKAIYLERGYRLRDIPRLILEKNLYGLDIDDRAAQLAGFALLMKAREDDRRLLDEPPRLNVLAIQESKGLDADELATHLAPFGLEQASLVSLLHTFEHAKTFGSLIQIPAELNAQLASMTAGLQQALQSGDLYAQPAARDVMPLVWQALVLGMQFDAVVANPPYMGGKYFDKTLKKYVDSCYNVTKGDLYACFVVRAFRFTTITGISSLITIPNWMFLSSFEGVRNWLLKDSTIETFSHNGRGVFGSDFGSSAFTFRGTQVPGYYGVFRRLFIRSSDVSSNEELGQRFLTSENYIASSVDFTKIPGSPIAYWASSQLRSIFNTTPSLGSVAETKQGLATTNNSLFLRQWYEVDHSRIGFSCQNTEDAEKSGKKWFPINKGGSFRRWFGNNELVINFEENGKAICDYIDNTPGVNVKSNGRVINRDSYFKEGLTWSSLSIGGFSMRYSPPGFIFETKGAMCFPKDPRNILEIAGLFNSRLVDIFLGCLSPTVDYHEGPLKLVPIRLTGNLSLVENSKRCIDISMEDWNSFETSWDFKSIPMVLQTGDNHSLVSAWNSWKVTTSLRRDEVTSLEIENNQILIEIYGLKEELLPDVPEEQITIARADREKDCQRLISYAIGCMMGRYRLDRPGLIYAHSGNERFWRIYEEGTRDQGLGVSEERGADVASSSPCSLSPNPYPLTPIPYPPSPNSSPNPFPADADGIIPITDEHWFDDDAAQRIREFLRAVWGPETLDENMAWLAESLGKKGSETPDETIRRYLADKFFKDHLQTYKKRPIYWLFSSGKQGAFQALVYLHRYNEGTLARMRNAYVIPLTGKIAGRIDLLEREVANASTTSARTKAQKALDAMRRKQVELVAYDEQLRHYADLRIQLDLDDGVKVNYGKFGNLLAEVKAVTGGASDD